MNPTLLSAGQAASALDGFDAVIDVRSPSEFALDHLPGAVNWPVLDDEERRVVGTLHKQVSALEARKVGAAMVARRIAAHLEAQVRDKPRDWRPLVYCWRGGQRSGTLAWFLAQVGFRTAQLQGGYKAFRAVVRQQLDDLPQALDFVVVCGRTGSGKTRLLQALSRAGAQVLDLEALACHRGSVLGALPDRPQPSQKAFDTAVWQALARMDAARPVFVESESAKIGRLQVPEALLRRFREHGRCLRLEVPDDERIRMLLQDYAFFSAEPERFCRLLEAMVELRGRAQVQQWQEAARQGRWAEVFGELMTRHYDPLYERSMAHNFLRLGSALPVPIAGSTDADFDAAAHQIVQARREGMPG